jgi:hypothetical protein
VIHPGRPWADRCNGVPKNELIITTMIAHHFERIGGLL